MRDLAALRRLQRHLRIGPQVSTLVRSLSTVTYATEATQNPISSIPFLHGLWTAGAAPVEGSSLLPSAGSPLVRSFASAANGNAAPPAPTPPPPPPPTPTPSAPAAAIGLAAESAGHEGAAAAGAPPPGPQSALWRSFKLALGLTSAAAIGAAGYATYGERLRPVLLSLRGRSSGQICVPCNERWLGSDLDIPAIFHRGRFDELHSMTDRCGNCNQSKRRTSIPCRSILG